MSRVLTRRSARCLSPADRPVCLRSQSVDFSSTMHRGFRLDTQSARSIRRVVVFSTRVEDALPKRALVQALPNRGRGVLPSCAVRIVAHRGSLSGGRWPDVASVVDRNREGESAPVVAHDEHRPGGDVLSTRHTVEVDQRQAFLHREAQAPVVWMIGVRTAVSIAQQVVGTECVVIRPIGSGRDGERGVGQHPRLEDALRPEERHADLVQDESFGEQGPRQHVAVAFDLRPEPFEGGVSDGCVPDAVEHVNCGARRGPFARRRDNRVAMPFRARPLPVRDPSR